MEQAPKRNKQFTQKLVMFAASLEEDERILFKQILDQGRKVSPGPALHAVEAVDFHKLLDW